MTYGCRGGDGRGRDGGDYWLGCFVIWFACLHPSRRLCRLSFGRRLACEGNFFAEVAGIREKELAKDEVEIHVQITASSAPRLSFRRSR